ncbi:hypothetical protein [Yinghuangia seranimata]|uniref:hypothetical protein n=1 Tax=Yinghuangia seranimata TaxID=408067 RepID=UPI00248BF183|nr:hypothetical protein [Yinghuangia seranimata]MDI2130976.1 hypothetical protein [Yinghuangia seranimata]
MPTWRRLLAAVRLPLPVHQWLRPGGPVRTGPTPEERATIAAAQAALAHMLAAVRTEVTEVGELLAVVEFPSDPAPGVSDALARALDSYDAAARLVDDVADVVELAGVVVLAGDARAALVVAAAHHRREAVPPLPRPCFFNPLHGRSDRTAVWRTGYKTTLRVPACPRCRKAVRRGDAPEALVDRAPDGRVVPYYAVDTAHSVWAATGFGAFRPDLAARVQRGEHRTRRRGHRS